MKATLSLLLIVLMLVDALGQTTVTGTVRSSADNDVLAGVSVVEKDSKSGTSTDSQGHFRLNTVSVSSVLIVSHIGYLTQEITLGADRSKKLEIILEQDIRSLDQVTVSTGYQQLPRERATGSFVQINQELLDRRVGTNILNRLEDVVPGLTFNRNPGSGANDISIRGQSTIFSNAQPLIVVDNFPYENDLSTINPNDIENITILKDAAAASIWGARAGNGVIVITTKKGKSAAPKISFNANTTLSERPDLFYQPRMSTADFIGIERSLFDKGFFTSAENSINKYPLPPVAELLAGVRDGLISSQQAEAQIQDLSGIDLRDDASRYLYRTSVNQQYALNFSGSTKHHQYYTSAGYDKNVSSSKGNGFSRISLALKNNLSLDNDRLKIAAHLFYTGTTTDNNHIGYPDLTYTSATGNNGTQLYPYARLADASGQPLNVIRDYRTGFINSATDRLLDWGYRPLDELALKSNKTRSNDFRINTQLDYDLFKGFNLGMLYQFSGSFSNITDLNSENSYFTRNLVNQFTNITPQGALQRSVPLGAIVDYTNRSLSGHNVRAQANYHYEKPRIFRLDAMAGAEIRGQVMKAGTNRLYGYDTRIGVNTPVDYIGNYTSYVNPSFTTMRIPYIDSRSEQTDRNLSYYANTALSYKRKYVFSASARMDKSNLFGVASNQKGVPLYSTGLSWMISEEEFFKGFKWMDMLKIRATYGYNGNINKNLSSLTTAYYSNANANNLLPFATIQNPPNPHLRWERIKMINLGIDYAFLGNRLDGSLEYFNKKGLDLIGTEPFAGSSGIKTFTGNLAETKGQGVDLVVNSRNLTGKFGWSTNLMFSYVTDKITSYQTKANVSSYLAYGEGNSVVPMEGKPLFALYSYRWAGLDPATGDPRGYLDGEVSSDYTKIIAATGFEDLVYHGPARPIVFGAVRNSFTYGGFTLSANISYRMGHHFRRPSVNYNFILQGMGGHGDFEKRWQQPGDERTTNTPSLPTTINSNRHSVYINSDILVEKADNIRLQDIRLDYSLDRSTLKKMPFQHLGFYVYADNIGVIWKATKANLDPDFSKSAFAPARSIAFGVKADL
jgi:TonB-linked SusC/RagA family outer membrane protein